MTYQISLNTKYKVFYDKLKKQFRDKCMHIKSTFLHLTSIGSKTEKELWQKGILTWEDYIRIHENNLFYNEKASKFTESLQAIDEKNIEYFANKLPKSEYYRLALSFPEEVMFLDIETTGLSKYYDHVTVIGWSIAGKYEYYVEGIHDQNKFVSALTKAKILVTFNGSIFDIPFIKNHFLIEKMLPLCHIDLRFFTKRIGLSGGQKYIEDIIGIKRKKSLKNTDGFMATVLWDEYKWGKKSALEQLVSYNHADIEGMKYILDYCIEALYKKANFSSLFDSPFKFKSLESKLDKTKLHTFVLKSAIPFDPKATLKFNELSKKINKNFKIIGIDLTGSEERASGVCLLTNNKVKTFRVNSNEDLINLVKEFNPCLVSIDSPLSLPKGRISVFDDDPGRDEYGILRICERILKKRGVNAYPTLLPSMQKLTKRGIELAQAFRSLGVPVIESYPGVVQDIIGLPRKQASLRLLKRGLGIFGLKGDFLKNDVSHDEIDGITSALVGMFFLSGDYEGIGSLEENLMIIPDLNAEHKEQQVFGFAGTIAAGKTTAARFFEQQGYFYIRYSQILEDILRERKLSITRENLQAIGLEMNTDQAKFSKMVYEKISTHNKIVIDGLRHPEDYTFFFEMYGFNFKLFYISASNQNKQERYINNGESLNEYQSAIKNDAERNILKLKKKSDKIITNNDTLDEFYDKLCLECKG